MTVRQGRSYLNKKYNEGYRTMVYTDDKNKNCQIFFKAANKIKEKYGDFSYRSYHVLNSSNSFKKKKNYFEVVNLFDLLESEKKITESNFAKTISNKKIVKK